MCGGSGEGEDNFIAINWKRDPVDVVLWREYSAGSAGGEFDDVKFLRGVLGNWKKWVKVEGEVVGIDHRDTVMVTVGAFKDAVCKALAMGGGRCKFEEGKVEEIVRVVEGALGEFEAWKKEYIKGEGWKGREERIHKVFKSWYAREEN